MAVICWWSQDHETKPCGVDERTGRIEPAACPSVRPCEADHVLIV
jgi:hypothetical protein